MNSKSIIFLILIIFLNSQNLLAMPVDQVDPMIKKLEPYISLRNGPNCWNSVLVFNQFLKKLRYSAPEELQFWLNSKYCRKLQASENLQAGDILALRTHSDVQPLEELHAMINLDAVTVFSKNVSLKKTPYEVIAKDLLLQMFHVTEKNCQAVDNPENCNRWSDNYRCEVESLNLNPEQIKFQNQMDLIGEKLEKIIFGSQVYDVRTDYLNLKNNFSKQLLMDSDFFWKSQSQALNSIDIQLKILGQ